MNGSEILGIFYRMEKSCENLHKKREYWENVEREEELDNQLKKSLSCEHYAVHEELIDRISDNCIMEVEQYFVEGFKLGLKVGIECMEK